MLGASMQAMADKAIRANAPDGTQGALVSMDRDGAKTGYDLGLLRAISSAVGVPVIASGGAGNAEDLIAGVRDGGADAVLAASIFHFGEISVGEAKRAMAAAGLPMRIE